MNRCFLDLKFHSGSIGDLYLSPKCRPDRVSHKSKRLHVHQAWNYPEALKQASQNSGAQDITKILVMSHADVISTGCGISQKRDFPRGSRTSKTIITVLGAS